MIDSCSESNFWGFEGIISREMDVEEKDSTLIRGIRRRHDSCLPMEKIVFINWADGAIDWRVFIEVY
jgi:hypothetical protein